VIVCFSVTKPIYDMKKLILLLFIPLVSFGQTYDDIMSIDSKEQFVRVMIENGFEMIQSDEEELVYALEPNADLQSRAFANYYISPNGIGILFQYTTKNNNRNQYDKIYKDVKSKCEYYGIIDSIVLKSEAQMVKYWCDDFQALSFQKEDGNGYIFYVSP